MKTLITAHSGCDGTADNSAEFVTHALQCGADALEVDVRARRDGSLYLSHDLSSGPCLELGDVFAQMQNSPMSINCDLKQPGLEMSVLALAGEYHMAERLLFSGTVSAEMMMRSPEVRVHTLWNVTPILPGDREQEDASLETELADLIGLCKKCGASIINVPYAMCSDLILDRLSGAGIGVSAWTVNEPPVAQYLLDHHIYNITTRRTEMLLSLRDSRESCSST